MRFWAGVTDNQWFSFLRAEAPDEVNFWQPSGTAPFVSLQTGAPFLFKLKRPHNHIGGFGIFVRFSALPLSLAWEVFERKNGAATRSRFEGMIRSLSGGRERDPLVGCAVLTQPQFWPERDWIPDPPGWAGNIVRGKYYDTGEAGGRALWSQVDGRTAFQPWGSGLPSHEPTSRYGTPAPVAPRLGQGGFRVVVTEAYGRRCAMTGESTLPVLEAAHIVPYAAEGEHTPSNGLLLRSDFHRLFDAGLVTVTPELRVEVSERIREEFFNGKAYYRLHGQPLQNVPTDPHLRPDPERLRWHNEHSFAA